MADTEQPGNGVLTEREESKKEEDSEIKVVIMHEIFSKENKKSEEERSMESGKQLEYK